MADMLLSVTSPARPSRAEDGDIIHAANEMRCLCTHAQHVCHPRQASPNRHGWIDAGHISQEMMELFYEYRFERISFSEVRRTKIQTSEEDILSRVPNAQKEHIDVYEYLKNRSKHRRANGTSKKPIYGTAGSEVWYGGTIDFTKTPQLWDVIEARTALHRDNHKFWPFTDTEHRHFLAIRTDDFTDEEQETIVRIPDNSGSKHSHRVDWRALGLGVSESAIEDRSQRIDGRELGIFSWRDIVQAK